ncbi:hypothetical protein JI59_19560 (plasmid) [Novosphingobium pentaromativorans US6-1]|nr:hypothetical protein JI59_19560 [Novosphingobium pentaromativorans US6-1]
MTNASGHHFKKVIISSCNMMAFDDFANFPDVVEESFEIASAMSRQCHFREHHQMLAQQFQRDAGAIGFDIAQVFKALDAAQARTGRKPDCIRQSDIGHAAVLLEKR